jgi:hypothetical protein
MQKYYPTWNRNMRAMIELRQIAADGFDSAKQRLRFYASNRGNGDRGVFDSLSLVDLS